MDEGAITEISRFLGIVIRMFYSDHSPPHFHAVYGKYEASFETIESWKLVTKKENQSFKKIKPLV